MNARFNYLEKALYEAIEAGHEAQAIKLVDILLDQNQPDIFARKDDNGRNFLQIALLASMPALTKTLLKIQIANPEIPLFSNRDIQGATSFHLATRGYHENELLEDLAVF